MALDKRSLRDARADFRHLLFQNCRSGQAQHPIEYLYRTDGCGHEQGKVQQSAGLREEGHRKGVGQSLGPASGKDL